MKTTNPKGPDKGSASVLRGCSWFNNAGSFVAFARDGISPGYRLYNLSFRIVCNGRKE